MLTKISQDSNLVQCVTLFFRSRLMNYQTWNAIHATIASIRRVCTSGFIVVARVSVSFASSHGAGHEFRNSYGLADTARTSKLARTY